MYLLLCPCILDCSLRANGITSEEDLKAYSKVIERCSYFNIPIRSLPCAETLFLGKDRKPGYYIGRLDNEEFNKLLDSLEIKIRDLFQNDGPPLAIIGVDSSPVCGVNKTWYGLINSVPVKLSQRGIFLSRFSDIPAYDVYDASCWKAYLAAPLFSEAERDFNKKLANILYQYAVKVHLPQETGDTDKSRDNSDIRSIFEENIKVLDYSDFVIAVLDGSDTDSGTAWEMGYAYAKGKKIISIRTDFREIGSHESVNLMLEQSSILVRDINSLISSIPSPIKINKDMI